VQTVTHSTSRPAAPTVQARHVENALDGGDGDLEAKSLRGRLAANPDDLDARMALARLYNQRGLPELALEHYRFAAARYPDSTPVTLGLAKTLRQMGQAHQAVEVIQAALERHPGGDWQLLSLQGVIEDERGELAAAGAAFERAVALAPDRSALHNNLGYNLMLRGEPDKATGEFRQALVLDPHSEIARNNLASALASQSHSAEAFEAWRSADPAMAHNNLAAVLIEQKRYAEARVELEAALKARPNFPAALANLKLVAAMDGQPVVVPPNPVKKKDKAAQNTAGILSPAGAVGGK
jgi:Flp pilus assembly protein TadD